MSDPSNKTADAPRDQVDWKAEAEIMCRERDEACAALAICRGALTECANGILLKTSDEAEINYERVMREVHRRMALAKEALQA